MTGYRCHVTNSRTRNWKWKAIRTVEWRWYDDKWSWCRSGVATSDLQHTRPPALVCYTRRCVPAVNPLKRCGAEIWMCLHFQLCTIIVPNGKFTWQSNYIAERIRHSGHSQTATKCHAVTDVQEKNDKSSKACRRWVPTWYAAVRPVAESHVQAPTVN